MNYDIVFYFLVYSCVLLSISLFDGFCVLSIYLYKTKGRIPQAIKDSTLAMDSLCYYSAFCDNNGSYSLIMCKDKPRGI